MPGLIDLTGKTFGRLTVLRRDISYHSTKKGVYWVCQCACGKQRSVISINLTIGDTKSCGCLVRDTLKIRNSTHEMSHTIEYEIWCGIKKRCYTVNSVRHKDYGGRGITVCERWMCSFENFYLDMGPRPSPEHSIDRINNNGPYSPDNCRWATDKEQQNNKRTNRLLSFNGQTKTLTEWSNCTGIHVVTIHNRIKSGWSVEKALTQPVRKITKYSHK